MKPGNNQQPGQLSQTFKKYAAKGATVLVLAAVAAGGVSFADSHTFGLASSKTYAKVAQKPLKKAGLKHVKFTDVEKITNRLDSHDASVNDGKKLSFTAINKKGKKVHGTISCVQKDQVLPGIYGNKIKCHKPKR